MGEKIFEILSNTMMLIFLIAVLGYLLGSIKICGLSLGTSGILLVALVFGHYGLVLPGVVRNFGLILFVTAVGFIAGPTFFKNFKRGAFKYIFLGFFVILLGAATTIASIKLFNIPTPLGVGMMTGALTSTPGLAAAIEATGDAMASTGYGIAYPFGVVGVVLFVQLLPKLIRANVAEEAAKIAPAAEDIEEIEKKRSGKLVVLEKSGLLPLSIAVVLGILFGMIKIPLPGGATFSFGNSGGPLIIGLLFGHFGKIGKVSLVVPDKALDLLRELGLALFLMGAGTEAGQGFIAILQEHGIKLFFVGVAITLIPMIVAYIVAKYALKLELFNNLGSITGGMTSTPALGSLITAAGTTNVAASYAATYPIALICVVLASQFISILVK